MKIDLGDKLRWKKNPRFEYEVTEMNGNKYLRELTRPDFIGKHCKEEDEDFWRNPSIRKSYEIEFFDLSEYEKI